MRSNRSTSRSDNGTTTTRITWVLTLLTIVLILSAKAGLNFEARGSSGYQVTAQGSHHRVSSKLKTISKDLTKSESVLFTQEGTPMRLVKRAGELPDIQPSELAEFYDATGNRVSTVGYMPLELLAENHAISATIERGTPELQMLLSASNNAREREIESAFKHIYVREYASVDQYQSYSDAVNKSKFSATLSAEVNGSYLMHNDVPIRNARYRPEGRQMAVPLIRSTPRKKSPNSIYHTDAERAVAAFDWSGPVKFNSAYKPRRSSTVLNTNAIRVTSAKVEEESNSDDDAPLSNDGLTDGLNEVGVEIETLDTQVGEIDARLTDAEGELRSVQLEVNELDKKVSGAQGEFSSLSEQVNSLQRKAYLGIASAASLVTAIPAEPGKTVVNLGYGNFEGEQAVGLSVSHRLKEINGYYYTGVATGVSDPNAPLVRAGIGFEF